MATHYLRATMHLVPLPAFDDNYFWLLHNGTHAWVVDPGAATPVLAYLQQHPLHLQGILITHHHHDHIGGVAELVQHTGALTYSPVPSQSGVHLPPSTTYLQGGETLNVLGLPLTVLHVPGHTSNHLAYSTPDVNGTPVLWCGDTLFSAGCGRLFEGTPAQMHQSLQTLAALPDNTWVCCAHEYTLSNLRFAQAVEPRNTDISAHLQHCQALRAQQRPTLPSTVGLEKRINPFLRCHLPDVALAARTQQAHAASDVEVFAALREWKNHFKT